MVSRKGVSREIIVLIIGLILTTFFLTIIIIFFRDAAEGFIEKISEIIRIRLNK